MDDRAHGQVGVAAQVPVLDHHVAHRRSRRAAESASEVVGRVTEPAVSREGLDLPGGAEAEVSALHRDFRLVGLAERSDPTALLSGRPGEPVVEPPPKVAQQRLDVVPAEAGEDDLLAVRPVVTVGVLEVQDVRRDREEDTPVPKAKARGPAELIREDEAPIEAAVAVVVLEYLDASLGGYAVSLVVGVVDHLDDPESPVLVEGHVHGTADVGLRGDELDAEALREAERRDGVGSGRGGEAGEGPFERLRFLRPACERGEREDEAHGDAHSDSFDQSLGSNRSIPVRLANNE